MNIKKNEEDFMYWFSRVKTEKTIEVFKKDLLMQDWSIIYRQNDSNKAYDEFVRVFQKVYDNNCPIKKNCKKKKVQRKQMDV